MTILDFSSIFFLDPDIEQPLENQCKNLVKRRRKMPTALKIKAKRRKNEKKGKKPKKSTQSPRTRLAETTMRTTRAKENTQNWEHMLTTNPERILRRK